MRRFVPLLTLFLLLFGSLGARAQSNPDLDKTFAAANTLLEKKQYAEALAAYQKILTVEPDAEGPLQNGAMAAYFAGDYKTALVYYRKLKTSDPNSGFLRAKLVQVYQAMGDEKARDGERAALILLHTSSKDSSSLAKRDTFCREQYRLGEKQILVYEPFVFAPRNKDGSFAVRYQFFVLDTNGKTETRIEAGWDAAKKDAKGVYQPVKNFGAFYFDAYYPTGPYSRRTMGLFPEELSYTEAKKHVQAILEGKVRSSGGTPREASTPKVP